MFKNCYCTPLKGSSIVRCTNPIAHDCVNIPIILIWLIDLVQLLRNKISMFKKMARGSSTCCYFTVSKWMFSKGHFTSSLFFHGLWKSEFIIKAKSKSVQRKHPQGKASSMLWSPWLFIKVTGVRVSRSASLAVLSAWEILVDDISRVGKLYVKHQELC